jgi:lipoprotein-releasing system permease protein
VQRITASSGEVSDIVVKVRDPMAAADLADQWSQFSRDRVQSWDQANSQIFEIFRSQDIFFNSITGIILLIVAFGIYNILNMVVTQKKREIAILKSFGFDERDIMQLFVIQGVILGVLGGLVGLAVGAGVCAWLQTIPINRQGFGALSTAKTLMVSWSVWIYVKAFLITLASAMVSSLLPARQGARLSPIEIIRGAA